MKVQHKFTNLEVSLEIQTPIETHSVMRGVVGVDKNRLWLPVVVVLVVVLIGLSGSICSSKS